MQRSEPLKVLFYRSKNGREPVRDWLLSLCCSDKKTIGEDIKTVQFGWPAGMPVVAKLERDLWEIRSHLRGGIARVLFTVQAGEIIIVHGFIKKTQRTPLDDLQVARDRTTEIKQGFGI